MVRVEYCMRPPPVLPASVNNGSGGLLVVSGAASQLDFTFQSSQ